MTMNRESPPRVRLALIAFLVSGCGLFDTRQAAAPQQGQNNFIPPTAKEIVIENLINAIAEKSVENYMSCLSDTSLGSYGDSQFSFQPPNDISNRYQSIFASWNRVSEDQYFTKFGTYSSTSASPALSLFNSNYILLSSDSIEYTADYDLHWPNSIQGYQQNYDGYLEFFLVQDKNGYWAISKWIDLHTADSLTTWSELKAGLINR